MEIDDRSPTSHPFPTQELVPFPPFRPLEIQVVTAPRHQQVLGQEQLQDLVEPNEDRTLNLENLQENNFPRNLTLFLKHNI